MRRSEISLYDRLHYQLTKNQRTENFYRGVYEKIRDRFYSKKDKCLIIGDLKFTMLSDSQKPTREEAYFAMEIVDILYPALFHRYHYSDEGPYEWGDVRLSKDDTVIDCGANIGVFTLLAAYRGSMVYSFEPIAGARKILRENLHLNPELEKRVKIIPKAVGMECSSADFTVLEDTYVGSSMVLNQTGRVETSQVTTIDDFAEENGLKIDFIKADIEGAERQMLKGASNTLLRDKPKLSVCTYHLADDKKVIREIIAKAGYSSITEKWKKIYAA